jgi:hypothetical protein
LNFDTTPGIGIFAQMGLPFDLMAKMVEHEQNISSVPQ